MQLTWEGRTGPTAIYIHSQGTGKNMTNIAYCPGLLLLSDSEIRLHEIEVVSSSPVSGF
jgi:hypothetical protein